jgi:thiol-disulfide isomerase/thioredoxin
MFILGCGHCKRAKPEYTAAAARLKDDYKVMLAAVDCTVQQALCKVYDVKGFPSFIYFSYLKNSRPYSGGRTVPTSVVSFYVTNYFYVLISGIRLCFLHGRS